MIAFLGKFGAALVASLVAMWVISFGVNMITGSATAPAVHVAEQKTPAPEATKTAATHEAAPETKTAAVAKPAEPAAKPAEKAAAAKPKKKKRHPGRTAYLRKGACAACHGRKGARAISYYPTIAGQDEKYTRNQIKDIMTGKRKGGMDKETGHPRTAAMVGALVTVDGKERISTDDIANMANWLTKLKPAQPRTPEEPLSEESIATGKKLYKKCKACHGKQGDKPLKGYPFLAGQKRIYIVQQMTDIRDKIRTNGKTKVMFPFVKKLSDEDIGSLADYLSQVARKK